MMFFAPGRLAFKAEGKTRVFAIPNADRRLYYVLHMIGVCPS